MQYIYRKWLKLANSEEAFDRDDWRFLLTFDGDRPKEQLVHAVFEPLPTGEQMADKFCALFLRDKAASKNKDSDALCSLAMKAYLKNRQSLIDHKVGRLSIFATKQMTASLETVILDKKGYTNLMNTNGSLIDEIMRDEFQEYINNKFKAYSQQEQHLLETIWGGAF